MHYGAQFADHIEIGATGITAPGTKGPLYNCEGTMSAMSSMASSAMATVQSAAAMVVGTGESESDVLPTRY